MTSNLYTLLCLVEGEANPISVDIDSSKPIDHLKAAIKDKKKPRFDDVAADELTLWYVVIPLAQKENRKPIVLNEVDSATELDDPTDDISVAIKEQPPKKTVSIIIQRPVPAPTLARNAALSRDVSRSSTPITSIFVPQDRIESELK
ncbi:hypothetical protein EDD11_009385 [Mortierella claussenii]|nr:hypothetical protein EDD11_009385 [Mortierella claussenii]